MNKKLKSKLVRFGPALAFIMIASAFWFFHVEPKPTPGEIAYQKELQNLLIDFERLADPGQAEAFARVWQNRFAGTGELDTPEGTRKAIKQLKSVGRLLGCPEKFDGRCLFVRTQRAFLRYHYNLGRTDTPNLTDPKQREAWVSMVNSQIDARLFETEAGTYAAMRQMRDTLDFPFDYVNGPEKTKAEKAERDAKFGGIGVPVDLSNAEMLILSPQFRMIFGRTPEEGTPLFGQVHLGDVIVAINDQLLDGLTLKEGKRRLLGKPGDALKLTVVRGKGLQTFDVDVTLTCNADQPQCKEDATIGIEVGLTHADQLEITAESQMIAHKPSPGSPALGKIEEGDEITKVDGVDLLGMRLTDARDKIRGEPNTPVVLTVRRKQSTGETATLDVTVVRKVIENHAAHFTALPGDIGSVELDQFSSLNVPGDVAAMVARTVLPLSIKALADRTDSESIALSSRFKQLLSVLEAGGQLDGASLRVAMQARDVYDEYGQGGGFILDLSHNPGGEFGVFEDVAGIFLPDGLVVSMQSRELGSDRIIVHEETLLPSAMLLSDHPLGRGIEKTTTEMKPRVPLLLPRKMPFVVLIGPTSASAAELTSGMLSAHKRAVLIGQTLRDQPELKSSSLGKGSGQVLVPLPYDYSAHVTRFEFFPGGLKSNERGVIADLDAEPGKQREAAVAEIARLNLGGAADRGAVQAARARYNKTFGGFLRERGEEDRKPVADQIPEMFH